MSILKSDLQKYKSKDYNVICDVCGRKRKFSDCELAYGSGDIAVVVSCSDGCADVRHPLNSPPPLIFDGQPVRDARPEASDVFINVLNPSFMFWGKFVNAPIWGSFNNPNTEFNINGVWTWGNFKKV